MIDSALFARATILNPSEEIRLEHLQGDKKVNKSSLYHMIHCFISMLYQDDTIAKIEKFKACQEFGCTLGRNFVEEECLGNVKYFILKPNEKDKLFLGEMKFLNSRIWPLIFGSISKLFAITNEASSYKLEDKDFGLTRFLSSDNEQKLKSYKVLLFCFVKGVLEGFLDKFSLQADIFYSQIADNFVNFEIKAITKKVKTYK